MLEEQNTYYQKRFVKKETGIRQIVTLKHIGIIALILIAIVSGVILSSVPTKFQYTLIFIVPAFIVCIFIMNNPGIGVYLFFLYEYLRPYDFMPALIPLRLSLFIVTLTSISWILYVKRNRLRISWDNFNWIFLAFLGIMAITIITAENNRYAYNSFQDMMIAFIVFVIATNMIKSPNQLRYLIWLLLLVHFYFAIMGIYNYQSGLFVFGGLATSGVVGSGFIGDENDFALALNVMIPFAFYIFIASQNKVKKYFSLLILMALVIGVVSSMSRGGWVGLMAVFLFIIFKAKRKFTGLAIVLILSLVIASFAPSKYWEEIKTISDTQETTAQTRINYWKAALRMYWDNPIIGVGANNGGVRMPEYVTGFAEPATQWGRTFHGTIPQVMAELGTLGLILYLLMFFCALKYLIGIQKRKTSESNDMLISIANSIIGALIAYIATSTFLSTVYYPQLWTLYTLTIILVYCNRSRNAERFNIGSIQQKNNALLES